MSKIISISMVKNEVDIIESFIRYNLRFVDEMHILDHNSTDNTRLILELLKQEGLPIFIYHHPVIEHRQSLIINDLMKHCIKQDPSIDYVLPLDADEFINSPHRHYFEQCLQQIPQGYVGTYLWETFLPNQTTPTADFLARFNEVRYETFVMGKVIIPAEIAKTGFISSGSHKVHYQFIEQFTRDNSFPTLLFLPPYLERFRTSYQQEPNIIIKSEPHLTLAHYPVRSSEQMLSKLLVGSLTMARFNRIDKRSQDLFWEEASNYNLQHAQSLDTLRHTAFTYRTDKKIQQHTRIKIARIYPLINVPLPLKYTHLIKLSALENLYKTTLQLLQYFEEEKQS
ncbi:glycosyltransferase family 2 protein [Avibacterium sp. 21-599]|uniref:glycosyltransferase family 2 protein n=1 Tax=Avibacterium sp. 21-599 TaxID=2911528 RepID=UPI00224668A4|nr:glycosyltransferase family 2 protein [Avibacterium sp. 21-599]MCW9718870.1 glycosyltransferase family 2 protein [Avibacterium sp. 21-599]